VNVCVCVGGTPRHAACGQKKNACILCWAVYGIIPVQGRTKIIVSGVGRANEAWRAWRIENPVTATVGWRRTGRRGDNLMDVTVRGLASLAQAAINNEQKVTAQKRQKCSISR